MKNMKRFLSLFLIFGLIFTACSKQSNNDKKVDVTEKKTDETKVFKDDLGREVTLKKNITRVAPSGNPAQVMLHIFEPTKLVGLSSKLSKETEKYVSFEFKNLPEFGAFYGKKANLNMEALLNAKPEVIIDMGEKKKGIEDDLNRLQAQLNVPVVFIELTLDKLPNSFERLAEVLGNEKRGKELSDYINKTYDEIKVGKEKIKAEKKVYFGGGKTGLFANAKGSIHSDIIEFIGAKNPIVVEKIQGGSGNEIPFEKLSESNPDFLIFESKDILEKIKTDETFKTLDAVKENKVAFSPIGPYGFFGRPPAANRIIGMKWLGNLIYPEIYNYDIKKEIKDFYKLFYNYDLKDEDILNLLGI
ncbi:MAG: ABC transporter substrate-binding protein [Peptoniphilaceae bacterium]|uniref:ABC transporter substrate-binding protein n=1 Tax=Parvimonas sp. TaxID=1944660 RepID=UPI0025F1088E|nr:ABC transporter substrate-binding protein [Parvimonas sp.]MCI5996868.1 ABC transporter substrate-binding protein [Parvimonas sp.]MDD7764664.1 ABC transporter substrate-binding protein [Peptoniphilaceae bacterium]MDY3050513.1 ABC transporter substrate-binding protein [Parvimonas sp.]